jgi:hypothetical protein
VLPAGFEGVHESRMGQPPIRSWEQACTGLRGHLMCSTSSTPYTDFVQNSPRGDGSSGCGANAIDHCNNTCSIG